MPQRRGALVGALVQRILSRRNGRCRCRSCPRARTTRRCPCRPSRSRRPARRSCARTRSPSCRPGRRRACRSSRSRRGSASRSRCSLVQVVRQVGVAVLHRYGSHCEVVTARQTPAPSQVRCGVSVDPTHVAAAHCVVVAQKRHAPAPLHMPSVPHVVAAVVAHCVAGVGAVPFATLLHVPRLPAIAHDLHVPVHAWLQQYPCAQKPESHSFAIVHAVPVGFSVQRARVADVGRDAVRVGRAGRPAAAPAASHLYVPHGLIVAAAQTPAPSHARDGVNVDPVQLAAAHDVPMAYLRHAPAPLQVPSLPQVVGGRHRTLRLRPAADRRSRSASTSRRCPRASTTCRCPCTRCCSRRC